MSDLRHEFDGTGLQLASHKPVSPCRKDFEGKVDLIGGGVIAGLGIASGQLPIALLGAVHIGLGLMERSAAKKMGGCRPLGQLTNG